MLCKFLQSESLRDRLHLIRSVRREELETPEVVVYLIECKVCGTTHSQEVSLSEFRADPLPRLVELWEFMSRRTMICGPATGRTTAERSFATAAGELNIALS
jgi:hypothetical protein